MKLPELDAFALACADSLALAQPRCQIPGGPYSGYGIQQLPVQLNPTLADVVPLAHQADNNTYQVSLQTLQTLIGGGGGFTGVLPITTNATALTIYNYGQYGALQSNTAAANGTSMTNMLTAVGAASPNGGWIWIPKFNYSIAFLAGGYLVPYNTIVWGLGGGGTGASGGVETYHLSAAGDGTLFSLAGAHSSGGMYMFGLSMKATSPTVTSTCAVYAAEWNNRMMKCNFVNWPVAYFCNGLSAGMEQCTVQYKPGSPEGTGTTTTNGTLMPNLTALNVYSGTQPVNCILSAPQVYVMGPGEYLVSRDGNGHPFNAIGVGIGGTGGGPVEHSTIRDIHLSEYQWAVSYIFNAGTISTSGGNVSGFAGSSGAKGTVVSGLEVACWSSAVLMVAPGNASIWQEKYVSCTFQKSGGTLVDASALVYINSTFAGGANNNIFDVEFDDCSLFSNANIALTNCYGYNIASGDSIRIIGGSVANMGGSASGSANIAIGSPNNVLVSGTRLQAGIPAAISGVPNNPSQYGVLIYGTPGGVNIIENCNMSGFAFANTINVTGTVNTGTLFVRGCPGYNDQQTAINTVGNIGTAARAAFNQGANGGTSYYGPSYVFYVSNAGASTLKINGGAALSLTTSTVGYFWLNSPYDTFQFSAAPASLQWVGE